MTGENYLAETVFQGNYDAYNTAELAVNMAGYGAVSIGATTYSPTKPQSQTMDSSKIRFSQSSIKSTFSDGSSLDSTINALKDGTLNPSSIEPIRIFQKDGVLYTLDNRRLYVAQQAGVQVNYVWATNEQIQNEAWKFTTQNYGTSIKVRGR